MKIIGIGVDIVHNKRISNLLKKKTFVNRTYSINEIKNSIKLSDKTNYYANNKPRTAIN